jgi:hypothetical protein
MLDWIPSMCAHIRIARHYNMQRQAILVLFAMPSAFNEHTGFAHGLLQASVGLAPTIVELFP